MAKSELALDRRSAAALLAMGVPLILFLAIVSATFILVVRFRCIEYLDQVTPAYQSKRACVSVGRGSK